ncbi:MAG: paraquat-inducible protein A [Deltaproteobacteria bacterium]|nr:paraquat-inducible protein A [Deltaproteobacteria bacterium]
MTKSQLNNRSIEPEGLIACPECDLLIRKTEPGPGVRCFCPRCRSMLFHVKRKPVETALILSLTGLILFVPAMVLPIMTLNAFGLEQSANILQWVSALFRTGFHMVGIVVLLTVVVVPLLKFLLLFYLSIAIRMKTDWSNLGPIFRFYKRIDEWGMLEICMLGILISIIKLKDLAQISYGIGLFCFVLVLTINLIASVTFDEHKYWSSIKDVK